MPKARLIGFAASVPGATPVPDSGMVKLGFDPFEVMLTLPLAAPLAVGEKSTENEVVWPAVKVTGKDSPLKLNPVPLALAARMVRVDPPVLVSVPVMLVLLPSCTLPNAGLAGLATSWPATVPVPAREMVTVPEWRLHKVREYSRETVPEMAPLDCGAKVVVKVTLWPRGRIAGRISPLTLNPVPDRVV